MDYSFLEKTSINIRDDFTYFTELHAGQAHCTLGQVSGSWPEDLSLLGPRLGVLLVHFASAFKKTSLASPALHVCFVKYLLADGFPPVEVTLTGVISTQCMASSVARALSVLCEGVQSSEASGSTHADVLHRTLPYSRLLALCSPCPCPARSKGQSLLRWSGMVTGQAW